MASGTTSQSIFGQGLELLWASVQDNAPVTAEVADQVGGSHATLGMAQMGEGVYLGSLTSWIYFVCMQSLDILVVVIVVF